MTCGRLGRGQLSPWGNACWLRNNYYLYFVVKVQTRAHFLALSWTSPGLLWAFSLNQQMCWLCYCQVPRSSCGVGHWAAPVMVTGVKDVPRLEPWTRSLAVIIIGWTKLINGVVILCCPTCDDAALLLNVKPVSFTPAWNVRAETFSLLLFEASLEKTTWGCFTLSLVSDGF